MKQVPEMISTKDLSYITDAFEWNFTASKKVLEYSKLVKDNVIKKELMKVNQMHSKICEELISLLK